MQAVLWDLKLPLAVLLALGFGVGWLGLVFGGRSWRLAWSASTFLLPLVSLSSYWHETAKASLDVPAAAAALHTFQSQMVMLALLTFGAILWAAPRRPWLALLPFPLFLVVFLRFVWPPLDAVSAVQEQLSMSLGASVARGLLMFCLFGEVFLVGMALATLGPRRKLWS